MSSKGSSPYKERKAKQAGRPYTANKRGGSLRGTKGYIVYIPQQRDMCRPVCQRVDKQKGWIIIVLHTVLYYTQKHDKIAHIKRQTQLHT